MPDIYGLISKQFSGLAEIIEEKSCLQKAMNITLIVKAKKQAAANKQTKPKATHLKWFGVLHFSCSNWATKGFDFKKIQDSDC